MKAEDSKLFKKGVYDCPLDYIDPKKNYDTLQELSDEDKEYLLHTGLYKSEKHLERISKNVVFFFWIALVNIIVGVILAVFFI